VARGHQRIERVSGLYVVRLRGLMRTGEDGKRQRDGYARQRLDHAAAFASASRSAFTWKGWQAV
jgi:hypothetical protein